jgi:hypothetical protein
LLRLPKRQQLRCTLKQDAVEQLRLPKRQQFRCTLKQEAVEQELSEAVASLRYRQQPLLQTVRCCKAAQQRCQLPLR